MPLLREFSSESSLTPTGICGVQLLVGIINNALKLAPQPLPRRLLILILPSWASGTMQQTTQEIPYMCPVLPETAQKLRFQASSQLPRLPAVKDLFSS